MSKKLIALTIVLGVGVFFFGVNWWLERQDLAAQATEIYSVRGELETTQETLAAIQGEVANLRAELTGTQDNLTNTQAELGLTSQQLMGTETELVAAEARIEAMDAGMFRLYDPTFQEALGFMEQDRTDANEYVEDDYVCSHFAADVNRNAERDGLRCALVDIRFPASAHAAIAFDTIDQGLVYFDPITDERVRPDIGKHYWKCIEPKPGYFYEKPDFDDTIEDIVVVW